MTNIQMITARGLYLTFRPHKAGATLRLTRAGRQEVKENREQHPEWNDITMFSELFDDIRANSETIFSTADRFGALSEAPCIVTEAALPDSGEYVPTENSRLFYFADYQIRDLIDALMSGPVFLHESPFEKD